MSTSPADEPPPADSPALVQAIQRTALGALLAGGVCLYFGFAWSVDAPPSVDQETTDVWYTVDQVFRWSMRLTGLAFLVVAALAWSGLRTAALLATIVEVVFAVLLLAMAVDTFLETRAAGQFDPTIILLVLIMVVSLSAAKHSWSLYCPPGQPPPAE